MKTYFKNSITGRTYSPMRHYSHRITSVLLAFMLSSLLHPLLGVAAVVASIVTPSTVDGLTLNSNVGNLSCTDLQVATVRVSQMWGDERIRIDNTPMAEAAIAIIQNDTAKKEFLTGDKDREVKIWWLNDCTDDTDEVEDVCDIGGAELTSGCRTYKLEQYASKGFSINHTDLFSKEIYDSELVAKGLMSKVKQLDELLAGKAVAFVNGSLGVNVSDANNYVTSGGATYIPATDWTANLFAYLQVVGKMNKFSNPYLLSGLNLYQQSLIINANSANGEGKGAANLLSSLPKYFDPFNVDTIMSPEKASFLINRGAIAFASKVRYNTPMVLKTTNVTKIKSLVLPGVEYQVYHDMECRQGSWFHDFKVEARYEFMLNPVGCSADNTGVLKFVCGNAPA